MASVNRKATEEEMTHAMQVIREAFPEYQPVFGGHSSYGGHRAPRDHTISFRLRDQFGQFHSNVIWVLPEHLSSLSVSNVQALIAHGNGARAKEQRKKRR